MTDNNVPKWNWSKTRVPSQLQKKKNIALVLMATMKTVLQNHLYEFDGQLYRQKEGGPIGENITQIAADLVMFKLMGGFKKRLKRLNLVAILLKLYVDDLNQVGECLPLGSQYKEGTLYVPGQG